MHPEPRKSSSSHLGQVELRAARDDELRHGVLLVLQGKRPRRKTACV